IPILLTIYVGDINNFLYPGKTAEVVQCEGSQPRIHFNDKARQVVSTFSRDAHCSNIAVVVRKNVGNKSNTALYVFRSDNECVKTGAEIGFKAVDLRYIDQATSPAFTDQLDSSVTAPKRQPDRVRVQCRGVAD